jgi:hypothetical protein
MQLRSLKHVVQAVNALVQPSRITVMGSCALLARDASLGDAGAPLELSVDADLLVEPAGEGQAAVLHEAMGEGSLFHKQYGVYADLLRPEVEETLPPGWRERCVTLPGADGVLCLDPYDLAVAKLTAAREKDIELLQALLDRAVIELPTLQQRYQATPMDEKRLFRAGRALSRLSSPSQRNGDEPGD